MIRAGSFRSKSPIPETPVNLAGARRIADEVINCLQRVSYLEDLDEAEWKDMGMAIQEALINFWAAAKFRRILDKQVGLRLGKFSKKLDGYVASMEVG